jgi:hypothetical protein
VQVTVAEAALKLRVSEQTIRRRLHRGDLPGVQVPSPQGFVWLVDLPDESTSVEVDDTVQKLIEALTTELEAKNKQIAELHVLLQQAQAALPAPRENRPWWQRLWHRSG